MNLDNARENVCHCRVPYKKVRSRSRRLNDVIMQTSFFVSTYGWLLRKLLMLNQTFPKGVHSTWRRELGNRMLPVYPAISPQQSRFAKRVCREGRWYEEADRPCWRLCVPVNTSNISFWGNLRQDGDSTPRLCPPQGCGGVCRSPLQKPSKNLHILTIQTLPRNLPQMAMACHVSAYQTVVVIQYRFAVLDFVNDAFARRDRWVTGRSFEAAMRSDFRTLQAQRDRDSMPIWVRGTEFIAIVDKSTRGYIHVGLPISKGTWSVWNLDRTASQNIPVRTHRSPW